jgi:hypothetical protein
MADWTPEQIKAVEDKYGFRVGSLVTWTERAFATIPQIANERRRESSPGEVTEIIPWQESPPALRIRFPSGNVHVATVDDVKQYEAPRRL